jgi:hypothetical protein
MGHDPFDPAHMSEVMDHARWHHGQHAFAGLCPIEFPEVRFRSAWDYYQSQLAAGIIDVDTL